jgi:hypothetical protein
MASMDGTKNSTLAHDSQVDPEKAGQTESDRSGEMEQSPEEPRHKHVDDATKVGDSGPLDGGVAAWLNVLGAWCCSFSSPGWCNSTYFPYFRYLYRAPLLLFP